MLTMYDSTRVDQIPVSAAAVAGYVNGRWPTYPIIREQFPKALALSIAVTAEADADCLDVEKGDAEIWQAADWVKRQLKRGVHRPVLYSSLAQWEALLNELDKAGVNRADIRIWTAHYTNTPHLCNAGCGFGFLGVADATQYTDKALGKVLDASLVSTGFFAPPPAVERHRLRGWILARRHLGWTWPRLKATPQWRRWWKLGGR